MKKFILVLVITIISSFTNVFTMEVKEENQDNLIISEKDENIEVIDSNEITEDAVDIIEEQQEIKQEQEAEVKQEEKITEQEENNIKKSATSTNSQNKNELSNNKNINIETPTTTSITTENSNLNNTNTEVATVKKETVVNEVATLSEEYKVNESKIAEIRKVIDNNPSEDMKLYGYQVVVDSSITEITTQFTYTEKRVKDKIALKFGTIKIYAQDYYKNGQYICTQCFII